MTVPRRHGKLMPASASAAGDLDGDGCFRAPIVADGFESGKTAARSVMAP